MVSPMSRVNSLVSADIGNYLTNKETWSSILFNVKAYGAKGDGVTDDVTKIQAAIDACYAAGGGVTFVPPGTYKTSLTITVKPGVHLIMTKGTTIKPSANVNVIQIKPDASIDGGGGGIECSGVTGFTKAAIYLDGADKFGTTLTAIRTSIQNIRLSNKEKYTGSGIKLYCSSSGDQYIQFTQHCNIDIFFFSKGIEIQCDTHATTATFVNGNNFDNLTFTGCVNAISVIGHKIPYEASGNRFTNFEIQPYFFFSAEAIVVDGSYNYFSGMIWDYGTANQPIAIYVIGGGSNTFNTNVGKINSTLIKDIGTVTNFISAADAQFKYHNPSVIGSRFMAGDQDDYLAYALKQGFAVTATPAPTSGSLNNIFDPSGALEAYWNNTTTDPIVIEIDMTSDPMTSPQNIGIGFLYGAISKSVKIEAFYSGAYNIVYNTDNNYSQYVVAVATTISNVSKLKFTLSNRLGVNVEVGRIFAQDSGEYGRTWLSRGGGKMYDNITFAYNATGPVLVSPNGTKYRIDVSNVGALSTTLVP